MRFIILGLIISSLFFASPIKIKEVKKVNDGLEVSTPEKEQLKIELLEELITEIDEDDYPGIHSILISRHNKLIVEEYFKGFDKNTPHALYSAGKSFVSAAMGICIDKGIISSANVSLYDELNKYYPDIKNIDDEKKGIKLKHLMSMTSGIDCGNINDPNSNCGNKFYAAEDPIKYFIDLPMDDDPGEEWNYIDAGPLVTAGLIMHSTKMHFNKFINENLFQPMQILQYPDNEFVSRDFLKLGLLYLNNGKWRGQQLVSEKWVKESTSIVTEPETASRFATGYGYFWWINTVEYGDKDLKVYFAAGNGHQYLFVVPELDLVVAMTGGNFHEKSLYMQPQDVLERIIESVI